MFNSHSHQVSGVSKRTARVDILFYQTSYTCEELEECDLKGIKEKSEGRRVGKG
jgi:hypothetical protein